MRYAWMVTPRNYLLLVCHVINETAQLGQGARFVNYWYFGGNKSTSGDAVSKLMDKAGKAKADIKEALPKKA